YEEFIHRAMSEHKIVYIRGKVGKVYEEEGKLKVVAVDTLTGKKVEVNADLVVLATAAVPSPGVKELAKKLRIQLSEGGWLKEAHLKLRPVETLTTGVYIAGAAQYPKDITDTVAQASGAAAKAISFLSKGYVEREPLVAKVDEDICSGCGNCVALCPYGAVELTDERVAKVDEALCEGCGACTAACTAGAISLVNYDKRQLFDLISTLVRR
ncbi:MAG: tRNA uridine 5-carboxymethylaminomethyl modification protein, partial [Thermoproteota archaeon]